MKIIHSANPAFKHRIWFSCLFFVLLIAWALLIWLSVCYTDRLFRGDLMIRTQLAAGSLNIDCIKTLSADNDGLEKPAYLRMTDQLSILEIFYKHCNKIYILSQKRMGTLQSLNRAPLATMRSTCM